MTFKHTYESVRQARDSMRQRRLEVLARIEQDKVEAESMFTLESDMTKLLDLMEMKARTHARAERAQ